MPILLGWPCFLVSAHMFLLIPVVHNNESSHNTNKVVQWVKVLVTQLMSWIWSLRSTWWKKGTNYCKLSSDFHKLWYACVTTPTCTQGRCVKIVKSSNVTIKRFCLDGYICNYYRDNSNKKNTTFMYSPFMKEVNNVKVLLIDFSLSMTQLWF